MSGAACEFCAGPGGVLLWQNSLCRVVRADEPDYPGFLRVILARHAREMTDLQPADRARLMEIVFEVEVVVRDAMQPDKMNVASLGNMTPHVHWHVIPRFRDDRHFPSPVWAAPRRERESRPERDAAAGRITALLRERLGPG